MPKIVDHAARRAELGAAVWRLVSRKGLDAVTVRAVSAEAGWSTGALVHYFADKEDLLRFAFQTVADRVGRRLRAAGEAGGSPAELLRFALEQGLPLDDERRAETRAWFSFLGLALTRPALARAQRAAYRGWCEHVAARLRDAQAAGELDPGFEAEAEATELVALIDGLAIQALFEPRRFDDTRLRALLDDRLARLQVASGA